MNSTATTIVDLSAIKHNLNLIREMMPRQKIMAMIKSNAYGHGLIPIANTLKNIDALGVATIAEALQLRAANIDCDVVVMRGFLTEEELSVFFRDHRLIACVHNEQQLKLLEKNKSGGNENNRLRIWLKIDTGMHRLGISCSDFQENYNRLNQLPFIEKPFVICSHLADADNANHTFTQAQIACFESVTKNLPNEKSLLNSAGILAHGKSHYDWVRPGLMLYGVSPFNYSGNHDLCIRQKILNGASDTVAEEDGDSHRPRRFAETMISRVFPAKRLSRLAGSPPSATVSEAIIKKLIPAMTMESKLIAIKTVNPGEKIGYSCTFTSSRAMKIGIVGMGYGDSYPRHAKNGTPVLIRGERCPIVGRVSMDMITVDVSHLNDVAVDDTVTLWGCDLLVSEIAQCVNTVPHELLCHLTGRVQRVYL